MPVEQDHRAVVRESCFALGGKMPKCDAIGGLISSGLNDFVIFLTERQTSFVCYFFQ